MTEDKPQYGRITGKGQVTIPKRIRDALGVKYGDRVDFVEKDGTIVVKKHFDEEKFQAALEEWSGVLGPLPDGMTVDEYIEYLRGE